MARVYVTHTRSAIYAARRQARIDRGPQSGDWLAVDSPLPNMGQSPRSIHKTTGRAVARLSSCATPTHRASSDDPSARSAASDTHT